jgi:hypothetical protein
MIILISRIMNAFKLPLSIILIVFTAFLSSCGDDKEPVDVRDDAMATYNYKTKYYYVNTNGDLEYTGSANDETGTFIVSKTTNGFEVKEGGNVIFKGEKVAAASNGFTFDIPSQSLTVDGDAFTVNGYDGVTLGTVEYNGLYDKTSKKLTGYFSTSAEIEIDGTVYEVELVFEVIGTKV